VLTENQKERMRQYSAEYAKRFPDREKARKRAWYQENKDKIKEQARKRAAECRAAYTEAEQEQERRARRMRYFANRETELERQRDYDKANSKAKWIRVRNRTLLKKTAGSHTLVEIAQMVRDQEGACAYCGKEFGDRYHVDHMMPLSRGGTNDWTNLAITCVFCNLSKHTQTAEEFINRSRT
jgi:5-methylcytosine-specific restriction endonuclease McrA